MENLRVLEGSEVFFRGLQLPDRRFKSVSRLWVSNGVREIVRLFTCYPVLHQNQRNDVALGNAMFFGIQYIVFKV